MAVSDRQSVRTSLLLAPTLAAGEVMTSLFKSPGQPTATCDAMSAAGRRRDSDSGDEG